MVPCQGPRDAIVLGVFTGKGDLAEPVGMRRFPALHARSIILTMIGAVDEDYGIKTCHCSPARGRA